MTAVIQYNYSYKMDSNLHNHYFYANSCHICKMSHSQIELKRCSKCKMISYCSKEHQKLHWLQHKDFCNVVTNLMFETNKVRILDSPLGFVNTEEWVQMKMNMMLLTAVKLGRRLEYYEEQMFKFPRACVVCHRNQSDNLTDCVNCVSASFCILHKNDPKHKQVCPLLKLCFLTDVYTSLNPTYMPQLKVPFITNLMYLPKPIGHFIDIYVEDSKRSIPKECYIARTSEFLTRPLTALCTMEKLNCTPGTEMVLHVIGANVIETRYWGFWELLLHWLPLLRNLKIVMIGPEIPTKVNVSPCTVCEICKLHNAQMSIGYENILYHDYVKTEQFLRPDLVIGYNLGLHECIDVMSENNTWKLSLQALRALNCRFAMTSYTLDEAKKDHDRLCENLGKDVKYVCQEVNPFSTVRPLRDFETEGVYYENHYLTIYENLMYSY